MKNYFDKFFLNLIILSFFFLLICAEISFPQNYSISGTVVDSKLKPIPGVNVIVISTNYGAATDDKGFYRISDLPKGVYSIEFSSIGFERVRKENIIVQNKSVTLNVEMRVSVIQSEEVLVTAARRPRSGPPGRW